jgi:hypothetical protein
VAVKFGKLLSQGEVEGMMDGVEGSFLVGDQPIDRPLLHDLDLPENFLHFSGWAKLETQANDTHRHHLGSLCHQIPQLRNS